MRTLDGKLHNTVTAAWGLGTGSAAGIYINHLSTTARHGEDLTGFGQGVAVAGAAGIGLDAEVSGDFPAARVVNREAGVFIGGGVGIAGGLSYIQAW